MEELKDLEKDIYNVICCHYEHRKIWINEDISISNSKEDDYIYMSIKLGNDKDMRGMIEPFTIDMTYDDDTPHFREKYTKKAIDLLYKYNNRRLLNALTSYWYHSTKVVPVYLNSQRGIGAKDNIVLLNRILERFKDNKSKEGHILNSLQNDMKIVQEEIEKLRSENDKEAERLGGFWLD